MDTLDPTPQPSLKKNRSFVNVYCGGPLLEAVQKARLFADCKHFVDMPLKADAEFTLNKYDELVASNGTGGIDNAVLQKFIDENFEAPGIGELEDCEPTDFNPDFESYNKIADPQYRAWAQSLHKKWPSLCRKVTQKVVENPQLYSLIPLPNAFVVPGGRFREMYYWDSFFTIKGLLASGMISTARGMIANMGDMIEKYGYVPNGNRIYYLNRSQPPLLAWCLSAYFKVTDDKEFVERGLRWLEREYQFFRDNRSFKMDNWPAPLYHYRVAAEGPRPESYREDTECAEHLTEESDKRRLWGDIAAAAESGRDFSARWFTNEGPVAGKMGSTRTSQIMPVDLNAIMCGNLRTMAELYEVVEQLDKADDCRQQYEALRECIHQVLWNEEYGVWFDYDRVAQRHIACYYDTNFFPLFTGCAHDDFDANKVVAYLDKAGVLAFPGGLPSSLVTSGQQWDFPNAWAPTTWVVIQGLRACGQDQLAQKIAEKWIKKNYNMWKSSGGRMFEKYNVESQCFKAMGGGGEYEMQEGFGWTNGVILDLLLTYNDLQTSNSANACQPGCECHTHTSNMNEPIVEEASYTKPSLATVFEANENGTTAGPLFEAPVVEDRPIFSRGTSIFESKPEEPMSEPIFVVPRSRTNSMSIFDSSAGPFTPTDNPIFKPTPLFEQVASVLDSLEIIDSPVRSRTGSFSAAGAQMRQRAGTFSASNAPPQMRGRSGSIGAVNPTPRTRTISFGTAAPPTRPTRRRTSSYNVDSTNETTPSRPRTNSISAQDGLPVPSQVTEIDLPPVMTDELAESLAASLLSGELPAHPSLPQNVEFPWAETVAPLPSDE